MISDFKISSLEAFAVAMPLVDVLPVVENLKMLPKVWLLGSRRLMEALE